jgi:hypothetical protein
VAMSLKVPRSLGTVRLVLYGVAIIAGVIFARFEPTGVKALDLRTMMHSSFSVPVCLLPKQSPPPQSPAGDLHDHQETTRIAFNPSNLPCHVVQQH